MWNWLKSSKSSPSNLKQTTSTAATERTDTDLSTRPKIIMITGTSGSGRKYTAKRLSKELGIPYVLPYTTRALRPKETEGEHYRFITEPEFRAMEERQAFFQTVRLERGSYGIAMDDLTGALNTHQACIVVVNHEGAQAFRRHFGNEAIRIFIYVTKEDIRIRLERESAPPELLEEYLRNYTEQVIFKKESEYLLQNIDRDTTVQKIKAFLADKGIKPPA